MNSVALAIVIILILIGIAGTVLPLLPGVPLVFIAIAAYGWYDGFHTITPKFLTIMAGLAVFSLLADYLSAYWGAKFFGSSKKGVYGALIGVVLGLFIFPPVGIFIGPWVGALIGELAAGKDWESAMRTGLGTVVGLFSGIVFKFVLALIMLISFLVVIV